MAKKKYIVSLTAEEREELEQLTTDGKAPAYKMNPARILLKADTNQEGDRTPLFNRVFTQFEFD
jgi:hypothetical protein